MRSEAAVKEQTTNALRGAGVVAALGVMVMAGWHAMHAPPHDAHALPLADGGRVVGIEGWPLFADTDGDGVGEVVFWRSMSGTLVAMNAESGDYVWESAPISGGFSTGHAWVTRDGLFVAGTDGSLSGLDPKDGRRRFRRELGEEARALCRVRDGLWVTLASGRTVALDPRTGGDLGSRPTPVAAVLLGECEPIWGDRFPDRGAARMVERQDWDKLLGPARSSFELAPHPLPEEVSVAVGAYLPGASSWLLYGARDDGSSAPLLARVGTRTTPTDAVWTRPATEQSSPAAAQRGPWLAATQASAFVAFLLDEERQAGVARFDLPSGRRRWEVRVAPRSLAAISASERHVVLTWAGGSLSDGVRSHSDFALMVLDAETGERLSQVGYATHAR